MMEEHWEYFNFSNIVIEATVRLKQAREHCQNNDERDTLEYWIAWASHADAIATAALLIASEGPKKKRRVARSCV